MIKSGGSTLFKTLNFFYIKYAVDGFTTNIKINVNNFLGEDALEI